MRLVGWLGRLGGVVWIPEGREHLQVFIDRDSPPATALHYCVVRCAPCARMLPPIFSAFPRANAHGAQSPSQFQSKSSRPAHAFPAKVIVRPRGRQVRARASDGAELIKRAQPTRELPDGCASGLERRATRGLWRDRVADDYFGVARLGTVGEWEPGVVDGANNGYFRFARCGRVGKEWPLSSYTGRSASRSTERDKV